MTNNPPPGDVFATPPGSVILLDRLGARPVQTMARDREGVEIGVVLDIGGRPTRTDDDVEHRYLMRPGQAVELSAELMFNAAIAASRDPSIEDFDRLVEQLTVVVQERIRARS